MPETTGSRFADRCAAGRALADRLRPLAGEDPVVLGLARGGVPVAYEVAQALGAPLDVLVVRKIGAPGNPELGIGAVAEGGVRVLNASVMRDMLISPEELGRSVAHARAELEERVERYRRGRRLLDLRGRTAIVVDDGLATGGTARAALRSARARGPRRLVLAVPVGARRTVRELAHDADEVVCLLQPEQLWAVGYWYEHFEQVADQEIERLLSGEASAPPAKGFAVRTEVRIPALARGELIGDLVVPRSAKGLILFAHGSASSRHSPRNQHVARTLGRDGFATLLLDLLTPQEELRRENVFAIPMLAERLVAATRWARHEPLLASLPIGYFGASTGAGAALWAASELGTEVAAVVSRGGRPDLASERLPLVTAPTLLIVGGHDHIVLELNKEACGLLETQCDLVVIPGATHLFEEHGALDEVAQLASDWFSRQLSAAKR